MRLLITGLDVSDVDAVFSAGDAMGLPEFLGIHPRWVDGTMTGGSSFEVHVQHAASAIALGLCDVALSVYAATPHSNRKRGRGNEFGGRRGGNFAAMTWELPGSRITGSKSVTTSYDVFMIAPFDTNVVQLPQTMV